MLRRGVLLSLLVVPVPVLATSAPASAETSDEAAGPAPWQLDVAAATATAPVFAQGLSLGATCEAERRFRGSPAFVSARLGWTVASAANVGWVIDHHQFVGALAAGLAKTLGVGRVWAQVGGGASGVYEVLSRHQRQRIDAAGVPGGAETVLTVGPYAFAEAGVGVRLRGPFSGFIAAGPIVTRPRVDGTPRWRTGGAARVGGAIDF